MIAAIITMLASGSLAVVLARPAKKVTVVPLPVGDKFTNHWYSWEGN